MTPPRRPGRDRGAAPADLEARLRDLGEALAWPEPADGFAERVLARLEPRASGIAASGFELRRRRLRRSLVLALVAVLVVAAVAAAIGLGLPGLRIVFDPAATVAPTAPTATSVTAAPSRTGRVGASLGLGAEATAAEQAAAVGGPLLVPPDAGPPDSRWLLDGRATLAWAPADGRPPSDLPGIGLLLTEFRGDVDDAYYEKVLHVGSTVEAVDVGGAPGYWLDGRPHGMVYVDADGRFHEETRRLAGRVLAWSAGSVTYRLESGLGRDAAIALAESLVPEG